MQVEEMAYLEGIDDEKECPDQKRDNEAARPLSLGCFPLDMDSRPAIGNHMSNWYCWPVNIFTQVVVIIWSF